MEENEAAQNTTAVLKTQEHEHVTERANTSIKREEQQHRIKLVTWAQRQPSPEEATQKS